MQLEIEQGRVSSILSEELELDLYLKLFDLPIPLLSHRVLKPLNALEGKTHFEKLQELDQNCSVVDEICRLAFLYPLLENFFYVLKQDELEPVHLFEFAQFLKTEERVCAQEKKTLNSVFLWSLEELKRMLTDDGGRFLMDSEEQNLAQKLKGLQQLRIEEIQKLENDFNQQTELRLIYGYGRELELSEKSRLEAFEYLFLEEKNGKLLLQLKANPKIEELEKECSSLEQKLSEFRTQKLFKMTQVLLPRRDELRAAYRARKEQLFDYALLKVKRDNELCFPHIWEQDLLDAQNLMLPVLHAEQREDYEALNLKIQKGANLLLGANMSGKTSVLKTLYFNLLLTSLGLPVPAKAFSLAFPEKVELLLKSSGHIKKGVSSFLEELEFLGKEYDVHSYVLVDEIFQSTDPERGVELSKLFIEHFQQKNAFFLASTHYRDLMHLKAVSLLKMKEFSDSYELKNFSLDQISQHFSYQVESLYSDEEKLKLERDLSPFYIALNCDIPECIKNKIKLYLS